MSKVYEIKLVITVDGELQEELLQFKNDVLSGEVQREMVGKYGIIKSVVTFTKIKGGEQ